MGRSHAMTGVVGGSWTVSAANAVGLAVPAPVGALGIGVCAGAALVPDLDTVASTVARALGPVTKLLAIMVSSASLTVYHVTRAENDSPDRESGHRLITHTPVGAVIIGALVALLVIPRWSLAIPLGERTLVIPSWSVTVVLLALLVGLAADGLPTRPVKILLRRSGFKADELQILGWALVAATVLLSFFVVRMYPGWSWLWPVMVTLGCHIHREGDWCTVQGVPRRSWPLVIDGYRWDRDSWSRAWKAGDYYEQGPVTVVLVTGTAVSLAFVTGLLWPLVAFVVTFVQAVRGVPA